MAAKRKRLKGFAEAEEIMISIYAIEVDGVWFGVAYEGKKVFATSFGNTEQKVKRDLLASSPFGLAFEVASEGSPFADGVLSELKGIYEGKGNVVNVALAMERLPAYTQRILKTVSSIPVGYVSSYGLVAKAAGGGARAVGNVMAANPFAPIVPCHRVVTTALTLGGYGGGLKVKHAFLAREKRGYTQQRKIRVNGGNLLVFPVEFVLEKLKKS